MARTFVVLVEIVMVRPPTRLVSDPWNEHYEARQEYSKALEAWRQAENLVNLNTQRAAAACDETGDQASETAHHVRRALRELSLAK